MQDVNTAEIAIFYKKSKNRTFLLFKYTVKYPYSSLNYKDGRVRRILYVFKKTSFKRGVIMKDFGINLWKIAVALYLIVNGLLGLTAKAGDFYIIFYRLEMNRDILSIFAMVASIIALVAGFLILLEMFHVEISILDTLLLIIAIIWAVYVIVEIVTWFKEGVKNNFLPNLQMLSVHIMVLGSLLMASKRFD